MFKKILMWLIYAGVVGLLIFGAVIRTEAKTEGIFSPPEERFGGKGSDSPGQGDGGSGWNGSFSGSGGEVHLAEGAEREWIRLVGVVTGLDSESLWIETSQGEILEVTGRAWRFIFDSRLVFSVGDEVELEGFYENDEFEVSSIQDLTRDFFLPVREDSGRPLWSGGAGR